jgi:hypothetical protein
MRTRLKLIAIISLAVCLTNCHKNNVEIEQRYLMTDWIGQNNHDLLLIEDSLVFQTIFENCDRVVKYRISFDTLIIYPEASDRYSKPIDFLLKYRILLLDSLKLSIAGLKPLLQDTLDFKRLTIPKQNHIDFNFIEFSTTHCFGFCPAFDLKITPDSTLYYFGYNEYAKHQGLRYIKLNPLSYSRIKDKLNAIPIDSFKLGPDAPDVSIKYLFIRSLNDSIDIQGTVFTSELNKNFLAFLAYLTSLDKFLDLQPLNNQDISFRNNYNQNFYSDDN